MPLYLKVLVPLGIVAILFLARQTGHAKIPFSFGEAAGGKSGKDASGTVMPDLPPGEQKTAPGDIANPEPLPTATATPDDSGNASVISAPEPVFTPAPEPRTESPTFPTLTPAFPQFGPPPSEPTPIFPIASPINEGIPYHPPNPTTNLPFPTMPIITQPIPSVGGGGRMPI